MNNYLCIDPSGTGTTGCVFYDADIDEYEFFNCVNSNWQKHFAFISALCKRKKVNFVVYESTNYINQRTKMAADLFRLLGAIEILPYLHKDIKKCEFILVKQVKDVYKKIFKQSIIISDLEKKWGSGWLFRGTPITLHELDALLILYLYLPNVLKEKKKLF